MKAIQESVNEYQLVLEIGVDVYLYLFMWDLLRPGKIYLIYFHIGLISIFLGGTY